MEMLLMVGRFRWCSSKVNFKHDERFTFLLDRKNSLLQKCKGPQLIRRRWLHKASDPHLYIGRSSSLAHAPVHSQDPSSTALKATVSPVKASYAGAAETTGDNHSAEVHPTDHSEVPAKIIPKDVLLRYFGSIGIASPPASPVGIHRERVEESLARGITTNKEETTKDSHDEVVAALQHFGSLRQEKNCIQTSFYKVNAERQQNVSRRNDLHEQLSKLRSLQLDNKIQELDNQQVVWELDQKVACERLANLENECTAWKRRLVQAMLTITTLLPADHVAEFSANTLMDLQSEDIASSVVQEVSADTQAFNEAPSIVVVEPLLGAEKGSPEEVGANEIVVVESNQNSDEVGSGNIELDPQTKELFLPFRVFCTRKDIQCHDGVLDDTDVAKAIVEYVNRTGVEVLILGATTRGGLLRFKAKDIPGGVLKGAPDFCTVHVISKSGKISSTRAASRPAPFVHPLRHQLMQPASTKFALLKLQHPLLLIQEVSLTLDKASSVIKFCCILWSPFTHRKGPNGKPYESHLCQELTCRPSIDNIYSSMSDSYDGGGPTPPRLSGFSDFDTQSFDFSQFGRRSVDTLTPSELSFVSIESDRTSVSQGPGDDLEAEMRRLKQELKQTMEMYSTACKEALTAKQKAR
ncbi:hypothetical protein RND71_036654 [Anisodus tanguticus]|uniref:RING-type E3 ubiquitin transferase n=1 Tax=Anisodus tanguticus TaxID=243964 RepID=A0AAE1R1K4_9SOLA|nr:hypothetical protein RND71_036654 [Anisodus tanguticus]